MSENLSTRNNLGHVPQQKGIPQRAHGRAQARRSAARPAQPQEEPETLRMPYLPQISPDEQIDNELMYTRRLLCAMIKQAVLDAKNDRDYLRNNLKNNRERYQRTAIAFLNSAFYRDLCKALGDCSGIGLPADKIKLEALK
jgi:hypothetical protein